VIWINTIDQQEWSLIALIGGYLSDNGAPLLIAALGVQHMDRSACSFGGHPEGCFGGIDRIHDEGGCSTIGDQASDVLVGNAVTGTRRVLHRGRANPIDVCLSVGHVRYILRLR
jgi:hypothetical protein